MAIPTEAGRSILGVGAPPLLVADVGVENLIKDIDALLEFSLLRRVLAMTEINFSNSLIEAWWRCLKHQWLFLNTLDSVARVRKLVEFYVGEHNSKVPHSAFSGQTPDEMYFGTSAGVADQLAAAGAAARAARLRANREARCPVCA